MNRQLCLKRSMVKKLTAYDVADRHRMLIRSEVDLLQECCRQLPDDPLVVNIGAGTGTSALAILEARSDAFVFSVDVKPVPMEREYLVQAGLPADRCVRVLGDSGKVGIFWPVKVDMVFVDGAHHDAAVTADIEAWRPKVVLGGIMLFHDYHHRNVPGLTAIVDRMMADCERIGEARYLVAFRIV